MVNINFIQFNQMAKALVALVLVTGIQGTQMDNVRDGKQWKKYVFAALQVKTDKFKKRKLKCLSGEKVVPYSIMSVAHGADPGFLAVSPQVT